jgi:CheY-like chemotaxis protein
MSIALPSRPEGPSDGAPNGYPRQRPVRWVSFGEARARLQGLTAVVLDPDVEASGRIFISLGQAGMNVRLARRFVLGLNLIDEVKPDLLIAATRLTDGDVLQLFTRLRAEAVRCPQLVALGGANNRLERRRFLAAGSDAFLVKPIDVRLFCQELARELPPRPAAGAR